VTRQEEITRSFAEVRRNIDIARKSRGIGAANFNLLAATKKVSPEDINYAVENLGLTLIGENRADELCVKFPHISKKTDIHFIGTLQTNKVKNIIDKVSMIHSLDSVKLAAEIDRQAKKHGKLMDILIEINIGGEDSKSGIAPNDMQEFFESISLFSAIKCRGIMTMAPKCKDFDEYRKYFKETYHIFIDFLSKNTHNIREPVLSMGMSGSYIPAIEEGSTMPRVGSGLFGVRDDT